MDNTVLSQLLAQGESEQVEFKSGVSKEFHVEEAACAFLNAQGGTIVVGVKDDGRLVGVPAAEDNAQEVQQRLLAAISPPAPLSVTVENMDGKKLIVINVPQGLEKPYVCKGKIMVRRGADVVPAVASDISYLIGQRAHTEARWERLPALGVEEDAFDAILIRKVAETIKVRRGYAIDPGRKPTKVLEQLGLFQGGQRVKGAFLVLAEVKLLQRIEKIMQLFHKVASACHGKLANVENAVCRRQCQAAAQGHFLKRAVRS